MGALRAKVRGASLVEAITASVIFLVAFLIALESVSRLVVETPGAEEYVLMDADNKCDLAFARYSGGDYPPGLYEQEYSWGKVIIRISPYGDYADLHEITVSSEIRGSRKQITTTHIIQAGDEGR